LINTTEKEKNHGRGRKKEKITKQPGKKKKKLKNINFKKKIFSPFSRAFVVFC